MAFGGPLPGSADPLSSPATYPLSVCPCPLHVHFLRLRCARPLYLHPVSQIKRRIHQIHVGFSFIPPRTCPPLIRLLRPLPHSLFRPSLCIPPRRQQLLRTIGLLSWLCLRRRHALPPSLAWCHPWLWSLPLLRGVKRAVLLSMTLLLTVSWWLYFMITLCIVCFAAHWLVCRVVMFVCSPSGTMRFRHI